MNSTPKHLPDLLGPELELVVVGTGVPESSAIEEAYYNHPSNKFWAILYETGITATKIVAKKYKELMDEHSIGLTDLNQGEFGCDSKLKETLTGVDAFWEKMKVNSPKVICFNGKQAAANALNRNSKTEDVNFGVQNKRFGDSIVFVAPSTSAAAKRSWKEEYWKELAALIKSHH